MAPVEHTKLCGCLAMTQTIYSTSFLHQSTSYVKPYILVLLDSHCLVRLGITRNGNSDWIHPVGKLIFHIFIPIFLQGPQDGVYNSSLLFVLTTTLWGWRGWVIVSGPRSPWIKSQSWLPGWPSWVTWFSRSKSTPYTLHNLLLPGYVFKMS